MLKVDEPADEGLKRPSKKVDMATWYRGVIFWYNPHHAKKRQNKTTT